MKTVAVYNIKGGVGKTTSAVNLAWQAARCGSRVLVWDLDPQAAATFCFRVRPHIRGGGKRLLRGKADLESHIRATDFARLDLLPADFSYRHMDLVLGKTKKPTRRLRKLLKPLDADYDYVLLDCPPGISLVSENVFQTSNVLLAPMIPTALSLRTWTQLTSYCQSNGLDRLKILPFHSMMDRRNTLHRQALESPGPSHPPYLNTWIPYANEVEQMGAHRQPLGAIAPESPLLAVYAELWREIEERLGVAPSRPERLDLARPNIAPFVTCVICGATMQLARTTCSCPNCGYREP